PGGSGGKTKVEGSGGAPGLGGAAPASEGGSAAGGAAGATEGSDAGSADSAAVPDAPVVSAGGAPYGCTGCTRLFNGMNLDGWDTAAGAWAVKPGGVLASKGIAADIYTPAALRDYPLFFQGRHTRAIGGQDHTPCTGMVGKPRG